ncbi:MAG: hypothetical protein H0Z39_02945 [Peptococcaceae bacterium]|nr:hypothetical protein [Peptococcaceae bacterium]
MVGWILMIMASLLVADALMALLFGRRYLRWGTSLLPEEYRIMFEKILKLPMPTLILIAFAELALGLSLHWLGWNLIR